MQSIRYVLSLTVAAALILAGCGKSATSPTPPPPPAAVVLTLVVLAGNQQTGASGVQLPNPLVVKVTDQNGSPVKDQVLNFRVLSGGGTIFGGTEITDERGIAQDLWTLGSELAPQLVEVRAVDNTTGAALVFATFTATAICDCWSTKAVMPTARAGLGAVGINGKLYTVGGYTVSGVATWIAGSLEAYDPATNTWTEKAWMLERWGVGVAAAGGILYAVGGAVPNGSPPTGTLQAYDPSTDTWTTKAPMPTARHSLGVGVVDGILYAIGGHHRDVGAFATVEAYDLATNTWTTKTPMPTARYALGVVVVNGILYAIGGDGPNGVVRTVDAYDPIIDTWTTKTSMPVARSVFGIGELNGAIYIAAGSDNNYSTVAYLMRYDPGTNSWSYKAALPGGGRRELTAATVGGRLYVVGGSANGQFLATVEAYQP